MSIQKGSNEWIAVESTALRRLRYDARERTLRVMFKAGSCYDYYEVPRSKFRALMQAGSKGEFVNRRIKPEHRFEEVSKCE